jgi:hypothetical protein
MTGTGLGQLLADAVQEAERTAPAPDPVTALTQARCRRERRRGHVAVLAFVFFMAILQALPSDAFGSPSGPAAVAASATEHADVPAGDAVAPASS